MNINVSHWIRRGRTIAMGLSPRERLIVGAAAVLLLVTIFYIPITAFSSYEEDTVQRTEARARELEQINKIAARYKTLNERLAHLKDTFAQSQMTFEEVTSQLDKVVKDTIGSDDYNLSKTRSPSQLGFEYEKQDFTLKINSLKFDQLIRLLYSLEQGDSPLFLGKVDIAKQQTGDLFTATLEIFSVRKTAQA